MDYTGLFIQDSLLPTNELMRRMKSILVPHCLCLLYNTFKHTLGFP